MKSSLESISKRTIIRVFHTNSTETKYVDLSLTKSFFENQNQQSNIKSNFDTNPTHKSNRANSRYASIQPKQEQIEQFEFDIIVMNQHSSMIIVSRSLHRSKIIKIQTRIMI